ncbi:MAG: DUF6252 family protein [Aquaticitalea sp.]
MIKYIMKKIAFILLVLLPVFNCADHIEFNTPAVQGNKDGKLWKAETYAVDIDLGGWLIEGRNSSGTLQLVTLADTRGTFELGGQSGNVAIFKDFDGTVYSTANAPDPSVSLYPADGQIIVEDINNITPKSIRGTFWFHAYTADGLRTLNFNEGVFYYVPIVGGLVQIGN